MTPATALRGHTPRERLEYTSRLAPSDEEVRRAIQGDFMAGVLDHSEMSSASFQAIIVTYLTGDGDRGTVIVRRTAMA